MNALSAHKSSSCSHEALKIKFHRIPRVLKGLPGQPGHQNRKKKKKKPVICVIWMLLTAKNFWNRHPSRLFHLRCSRFLHSRPTGQFYNDSKGQLHNLGVKIKLSHEQYH